MFIWKLDEMVHIPGYNYCGLLNKVGSKPVNRLDRACQLHDDSGDYRYGADYFRFRPSDQVFLEDTEGMSSMAAIAARSFFKVKKVLSMSHLPPHLPRNRKRARFPRNYVVPRRRRTNAGKTYSTYPYFVGGSPAEQQVVRGLMQMQIDEQQRRLSFPSMGMYQPYRRYRRSFGYMPGKRYRYGRRRRRRTYKRRRYNKSRYYRSLALRLQQALLPSRSAIKEGDLILDITEGLTHFWTPTSFMCVPEMTAILGETGESAETVAQGTLLASARYCLAKASAKWRVTNLNRHPMYVKVYWLLVTDKISDSGEAYSTCQEFIHNTFRNGLDERMLDADETAYFGTPSTVNTTSQLHSIHPYDSTTLKNYCRIINGKSFMLMPGDESYFEWKRRKPYFAKGDIFKQDDTGKQEAIPYLTVVPMFKVRMAMGRDVTNQTTEQAYMSGQLNIREIKRFTFKAVVEPGRSVLGVNAVARATSTFGLEGFTEMDEKADE